MGAKDRPVGIVEIQVVLPAYVLASAHVVMQIFQLVLAVNVVRQNGVFQIAKEIPADHGVFEVDIITEPLLVRIKGNIAVAVIGEKPDGQLVEGEKIPPEKIGVFFQQLAVPLVAGP